MIRLINILAEENGGHDNITVYNDDYPVPEGWAVIPNDMEIPATFPFVFIEHVDGVVTRMIEGVMPEPPAPEPGPEPEGDVWDELAEAIRNGVNEVD